MPHADVLAAVLPTHSLAERIMKLLLSIIAIAVSSFLASVSAFVGPSCITPSTQTRNRSAAQRLRADAEGLGGEACPGYPRCSGEYREKGCDGTGRIAGGVGALLPWLPVKAYRPCPSFVEAKYKYSRQGQSLNEVVFARREGTMADITMDSIGEMKEADLDTPAAPVEATEGGDEKAKEGEFEGAKE